MVFVNRMGGPSCAHLEVHSRFHVVSKDVQLVNGVIKGDWLMFVP